MAREEGFDLSEYSLPPVHKAVLGHLGRSSTRSGFVLRGPLLGSFSGFGPSAGILPVDNKRLVGFVSQNRCLTGELPPLMGFRLVFTITSRRLVSAPQEIDSISPAPIPSFHVRPLVYEPARWRSIIRACHQTHSCDGLGNWPRSWSLRCLLVSSDAIYQRAGWR
jgi:hypothetical protein